MQLQIVLAANLDNIPHPTFQDQRATDLQLRYCPNHSDFVLWNFYGNEKKQTTTMGSRFSFTPNC